MDAVSLKIPEQLNQSLDRCARQRGLRKSQLMRQVLERFVEENDAQSEVSILSKMDDLVGVFDGPEDLGIDPKYMNDYGR